MRDTIAAFAALIRAAQSERLDRDRRLSERQLADDGRDADGARAIDRVRDRTADRSSPRLARKRRLRRRSDRRTFWKSYLRQ